jgi:hypothetical protein
LLFNGLPIQLKEQTAGGAACVALNKSASKRILDSLKLVVESGNGDAVEEQIGIVEARLTDGNCHGPSS